MSRKGRDFMSDFVSELMDKTVEEEDLIKSLSQNLGKNKEKTKNRDRLTSYRFNGREKKSIKDYKSFINCDRKDEDYRGQTPFHIAIAMANPYTGDGQDLVEAMIDTLERNDMLRETMECRVSGKKLRGTIMLGGTPLSIAALDNNATVVDLLLGKKANLIDTDSCGNTVFHSMVLYASFHPEKVPDILSMFDKLAKHDQSKYRQNVQRENARKQTALHLAAELGLDNVFSHILELKDAYKFFFSHDGVFEIYECDITELDKATWDRAELYFLATLPSNKTASQWSVPMHFVLFGFALLIDASWNVGTVTNNYCLVIALILGWWSTTFFLRGIKPLSYITLMLQKVLFGDMVKFIPIILIMIVGFTSALHSSFAETRPEMFGNFSVSLLTTFSLMTGQGQLEQLEESSKGICRCFCCFGDSHPDISPQHPHRHYVHHMRKCREFKQALVASEIVHCHIH
ncbi:transient receptor potential cation channel subfamily V member 5-like [Haliotis rubra]|uniref:transient receptor potential cation channel subfamily V member 5-like n=1 Tax=Haliotis rubra TaxID=36100 RepID=UPI001EE58682|nr:transient receptor potential cation channel subfamily V member 5-like [Haliotis rubra]